MYRITFGVLLIILTSNIIFAQDTLKLSRQQCETIFLSQNLPLIAEKLKITQAEAAIIQARLWPNPNLTIDQINLWATPRQTGGETVSPPFWNNVGRNQQFGIEIEQLILTAGKRKKLIAIEQIGLEKAQQYVEELLRNLKITLRQQITELQYTQYIIQIIDKQLESLQHITAAYQKQVTQGNIAQSEFIRLKAQEFALAKEVNDLNRTTNEIQSELKKLMHLPYSAYLIITDTLAQTQSKLPHLSNLIDEATINRPDLKLAELEINYFNKLYLYEKAQRTPDLNIKGAYDRNGNTMLDFVGFGVAMDIPVFNRNQGNIKSAKAEKMQAEVLQKQIQNNVANEVAQAYSNYKHALDFVKNIDNNYIEALSKMLDAYTKNFMRKNISLLEYLDFLEAFSENNKSISEINKTIINTYEELNYAVGKDL